MATTKLNFLDKITKFLEEKFMPVGIKIASQRHLKAIRDGIISSIPLTILGGLSLVIAYPPIDPERAKPTNFFLKFMLNWNSWATANEAKITMPFKMSMAIMSVFVAMAIAYHLANHYKLDALSSAIVSGVTFLLVASPSQSAVIISQLSDGMKMDKINKLSQSVMPMKFLDAKGLFVAIIVGLITVEITRILKRNNIIIKMPDGVPPAVASSFESLIPLFLNVAIFYAISLVVQASLNMTLPEGILSLMSPAMGMMDSAGAVFGVATIVQGFWFIGIHGSAATNGFTLPFEEGNLLMNATQKMSGQAMTQIFTTSFWDYLIVIGGCGATLALVILMMRSKSAHLKEVGKVAFLPAIFNINEPVIFGAPLVLNPVMALPFIFVQGINGVIAFELTKWGVIGHSFIHTPWTTPAPIGAFLSTLDWKAGVLVILLIILDGVLYYPFFKAYEKQLLKEEESC